MLALIILSCNGGQGEREREADRQTDRQTDGQTDLDRDRETENSNSKTLFHKDCNFGSVKTTLTTSQYSY